MDFVVEAILTVASLIIQLYGSLIIWFQWFFVANSPIILTNLARSGSRKQFCSKKVSTITIGSRVGSQSSAPMLKRTTLCSCAVLADEPDIVQGAKGYLASCNKLYFSTYSQAYACVTWILLRYYMCHHVRHMLEL